MKINKMLGIALSFSLLMGCDISLRASTFMKRKKYVLEKTRSRGNDKQSTTQEVAQDHDEIFVKGQEREFIIGWITEAVKIRELTKEQGEELVDVVNGYPNYFLMVHDLKVNVLGSLWNRHDQPWYMLALKASLVVSAVNAIESIRSAIPMFFEAFKLVEIYGQSLKYSNLKCSCIGIFIHILVMFFTGFILNFIIFSGLILVGRQGPEKKELSDKELLVELLQKKGVKLSPNYYQNRTNCWIAIITFFVNSLLVRGSGILAKEIEFILDLLVV